MKSFTDLEVWNAGLQLVKDVYVLTKSFPREEMFGLTSQIRRASTSIIANLAEGCGRYTYADKASKFVIARGECTETEALLRISAALEYTRLYEVEPLIQRSIRVGKLLSGLIASVHNRQTSNQ